MPIIKNKTTPENREFWEHVERVAEQVRHWPESAGGKGVEPLCCPCCNRPYPQTERLPDDESETAQALRRANLIGDRAKQQHTHTDTVTPPNTCTPITPPPIRLCGAVTLRKWLTLHHLRSEEHTS